MLQTPRIRDLDPHSPLFKEEICLVASRMRETLIEILGQEKGTSLYKMEWLIDRVLWHLDPKNTTARVLLSVAHDGHITGQAIARIEREENGTLYGYFSTLFVEAESRRQGIATALMNSVESWFREKQMTRIVYNTAHNNSKLVDLFYKHGYRTTLSESEMVQLTKRLDEAFERSGSLDLPVHSPFEQPCLNTPRLVLDRIDESHAEELCELFQDTELHRHVPFEPLSIEKQRERCARWAKRRSPDQKEIWLNWVARDKTTKRAIGHFQAGISQEKTASIAYLVARTHQRKGFSTEALQVIFDYLRDGLGVREVRAWVDTRNEASIQLARKLGMVQTDFIKNADFFKGASSDEFVFSKVLL